MKYVRVERMEADRFGKWLAAHGYTIDRDSEHVESKNHYFIAWPPKNLNVRRVVLHRFSNRKTGEWIGLASTDDAWKTYQRYLNTSFKASSITKSDVASHKAPSMRKRISLSDYQPQEMRDQYPVPFDIPEDVELSVECRIYFSQHPQEFPEWLEIYRTATA